MSQDSQRGSGPPGAPPEEGARDRQALLDSLLYWTWTATADGRVDYFSPQAASFTGAGGDQLLESGWMQRVHPDDRDEVASVWNDAFDKRADLELELELRVRHHDGEYRWLLWRGASKHRSPVLATPAAKFRVPSGLTARAPCIAGVLTQRFRYHSARPARSLIPWIIPWPTKPWPGSTPGNGFGPLRK